MRRARARLAGGAVGLALIAAALGFGLRARSPGALVLSLPGPDAVVAQLFSRPAGDLPIHTVVLTDGARRVEVLRLEGAPPALVWREEASLLVCTGAAPVLRFSPEARFGDVTVPVLVAPGDAAGCAP